MGTQESRGERPPMVSTRDLSIRFELPKRFTEVLVPDAKESSQLQLTLRTASRDGIEDALCERGFDGDVFLGQFETHRG